MSDHLRFEEISQLLDDPEARPGALRHLEECEECGREHERMRRMRMALSALDDRSPPEGEWERIRSRLPAGGGEGRPAERAAGSRGGSGLGWPARAAAAAVVFGLGVAAGMGLDGIAGAGPDAAGPTRQAADAPRAVASDAAAGRLAAPSAAEDAAAPGPRSAAAGGGALDSLLSGRGGSYEPVEDPVAAAEQMARLDALADAVREALERRPADPALNNLLFELSERRDELRSRVGGAARLASLSYR